MKINAIKVKNIKNVRSFELPLGGATVLVTAGNNRGKSTILRSLIDRLRGEKPEFILKHGEIEGAAELELTDGSKFVWEIKEDKEKLTYTTQDGVKTSTIKDISRRYFPETFDIDEFLQDRPQEQLKTLQKLIGVDFTALDTAYKSAYEERQLLNRMCAEKKRSSAINSDPALIGTEKINTQTVLIDLDILNAKEDDRKKSLLDLEFAQKEADEFRRKLKAQEENIVRLEKKLNKLPSNEHKITELKSKLIDAETYNQEISKANDDYKIYKEFEALSNKANSANGKLKEIEDAKKELINSANLPEGITIENEEIKIHGLPLNKNQIGTAMLYMTALRLAALQLGQVKTLYFDASTLDKSSLEEILCWAQSQGLQLLIERADYEGGEIKYQIIEE